MSKFTKAECAVFLASPDKAPRGFMAHCRADALEGGKAATKVVKAATEAPPKSYGKEPTKVVESSKKAKDKVKDKVKKVFS